MSSCSNIYILTRIPKMGSVESIVRFCSKEILITWEWSFFFRDSKDSFVLSLGLKKCLLLWDLLVTSRRVFLLFLN